MKDLGWMNRGKQDKANGKPAKHPENVHYMKGYNGDTADLDRVASMLEKLQALASHKATGKAEAENAAAKMQKILLMYNLEMSDLKLDKEEITTAEHNLTGSSCEQVWRSILHDGIAEFNFCRSVRSRGTRVSSVVGKKHNMKAVLYMYEYLSKTIWRLAKEAAEAKEMGLSGRYTFLNSFAQGATNAIVKRLKEEREAASKAKECRDLVVVQDALVVQKFEKLYKVKAQKSNADFDAEAYMKGKKAGEKMTISKGLEKTEKAAVA